MPITKIDTKDLRKIIREETAKAVKESLDEELRWMLMEVFLRQAPCVSDDEQKEIEKLCGKKPCKRKAAKTIYIEV